MLLLFESNILKNHTTACKPQFHNMNSWMNFPFSCNIMEISVSPRGWWWGLLWWGLRWKCLLSLIRNRPEPTYKQISQQASEECARERPASEGVGRQQSWKGDRTWETDRKWCTRILMRKSLRGSVWGRDAVDACWVRAHLEGRRSVEGKHP